MGYATRWDPASVYRPVGMIFTRSCGPGIIEPKNSLLSCIQLHPYNRRFAQYGLQLSLIGTCVYIGQLCMLSSHIANPQTNWAQHGNSTQYSWESTSASTTNVLILVGLWLLQVYSIFMQCNALLLYALVHWTGRTSMPAKTHQPVHIGHQPHGKLLRYACGARQEYEVDCGHGALRPLQGLRATSPGHGRASPVATGGGDDHGGHEEREERDRSAQRLRVQHGTEPTVSSPPQAAIPIITSSVPRSDSTARLKPTEPEQGSQVKVVEHESTVSRPTGEAAPSIGTSHVALSIENTQPSS